MKLGLIKKFKYAINAFLTFVTVTFYFFPEIIPISAIQPPQKTQDEVRQWNALTFTYHNLGTWIK